MKVYSLYHKDTFVAAFSNREEALSYGKIHYKNDPWDCNILEEYLNKTPYQMYTPPYTSFTPQQTIPCKVGLDMRVYPNSNVRAEDYPVELVGEPGPEPHS
jgi:hypothetical protein